MTARPSGLDAATGSTSVSASGTQARSLSSPSTRTTTAASAPLSGTPASLSAWVAVVPPGTFTVATAGASGTAGTAGLLGRCGVRHRRALGTAESTARR